MSRADFKPEKYRQLVGTVNAAKRKERAAKTAGEKLLGSSGGFLPSFEQMAIELGRQEDYDFFYRGLAGSHTRAAGVTGRVCDRLQQERLRGRGLMPTRARQARLFPLG